MAQNGVNAVASNNYVKKDRHTRIEKLKNALSSEEKRDHSNVHPAVRLAVTIIWAAVLLLGAYLTISMTIDLINQYNNDVTTSTITVMFNQSINFPFPPTFCIDVAYTLYSARLWYMQLYDTQISESEIDEYLKTKTLTENNLDFNHSNDTEQWPPYFLKAVDQYINYDEQNVDQADTLIFFILTMEAIQQQFNITQDALKKRRDAELNKLSSKVNSSEQFQMAVAAFFQQPDLTSETFLYTNNSGPTWPISWLFLVHNCLALAQDVEAGASGLESLDEYDYQNTAHNTDKLRACIAMENYLQKMNVTTDQVRQKYGTELWFWYGISFEQTYLFNISVIRTTEVADYEVCYKLNITPPFTSAASQLTLYARTNSDFPLPIPLPASIYLDMTGIERDVRYKYNPINPVVNVDLGSKTTSNFKVDADYISLPVSKGQSRCNPDLINLVECQRNCKVATIKEAFGCVPSSLVQLADGDRECSIATLSDWDYDPQNQSQAEMSCNANCLNSCEHWSLQLNVVTSKTNKNFAAFAQLDIFITSFDYVVYRETVAWTFEMFVGALGGVIGLWLGIDLLVTVQFFLASIGFVFAVLTCGRYKKQPVERTMQDCEVQAVHAPKGELSVDTLEERVRRIETFLWKTEQKKK